MPFQIVRNDITKMHTDAIVNSANPAPHFAGGVDYAIYEAAGKEALLTARKAIGNIAVGAAAVTPAFGLQAKFVIHTVGPLWQGGNRGEREAVRACYENALRLAAEHHCESIAFPLLATGVYGFPKAEALQLAISAIGQFLLQHEMQIYLVVFDQQSFELSGKLFQAVDEYIDANYAVHKEQAEYKIDSLALEQADESVPLPEEEPFCCSVPLYTEERSSKKEPKHRKMPALFSMAAPAAQVPQARSLEDVVSELGETFSERLFRLIDEKGKDDVEIYKKANLDRKLFSKIRSNPSYKPGKRTAVALAIALELNLDETKDFLARAELALSPSSKFDLIIQYFILNEVYDIYTINLALFQHGQLLLGA